MTANPRYKYSFSSAMIFWFSYCWYRFVAIWWDVKFPKFNMFLYEMGFTFGLILKHPILIRLEKQSINFVHTRFGKLYVRSGTMDVTNASPAYERQDMNELLSQISHAIKTKKVLFVDVGANIGSYSVAVGNIQGFSKQGNIIAFEPNSDSAIFFKKNIEANQLNNITHLIPMAISDTKKTMRIFKNENNPGGSSAYLVKDEDNFEDILSVTLDEYINNLRGFDHIFLKIDVEKAEKDVIRSGKAFFELSKEVTLLIEDFMDSSIIQVLEDGGFEFDKKLTRYNSFWHKKAVATELTQFPESIRGLTT